MSNPKPGTAAADMEALEPETASLEWRGETFTFPANIEDWDADYVEEFEAGKAMSAVHHVLGDVQWARIKKVSNRTVRDVTELFEAIAKKAGFEGSGE